MPRIIKDGQITDNTWTLLKPEGDAADAVVPEGQVLVPLAVWQAQQEQLSTRTDIGIWLNSDETVDKISKEAARFPVIALNFPVFTDGRSFSSARLLRERYGYTGEIRAVGYFLRDQLCYMRRCGFNAFVFADDTIKLEEAIKSLSDFSEYYQAAVDQRLPLFRRRG